MNDKVSDKYKLCCTCGNFYKDTKEQLYCIVCGGRLIDKCNNCGASIIHPTGKYCHNCGEEYTILGSAQKNVNDST